ncbi:MAG: GNAT family N-acetyltransferase [Wenzhouxiangellaceae bacterium]
MSAAEYTVKLHASLTELAAHWDELHGSSNPFVDSRFLLALEQHGAVANDLGWQPLHLSLQHRDRVVAAAPGYLTSHSFGDFVYDWGWAQQAQQAGFGWYPKWVIEVPYSPVTGPRLLTRPLLAIAGMDAAGASALMVQAIKQVAAARDIDCVQINYCSTSEAQQLADGGFLIQHDSQFHWQRRGATDFAGFLQQLRSKRRKEIRRERDRVAAQGISHRWVSGADASEEELRFAHLCYEKTFHEKGNFPALTLDCLHRLAHDLGPRLLLCLAASEQAPLAAAICLRSDSRLYGRYWGSIAEIDCLHFETCYYQGIDYCLAHGLDVFEPGAGGGHKLQRGFVPTSVYTCHWFQQPALRAMMHQQMQAEAQLRQAFGHADSAVTPYKRQ